MVRIFQVMLFALTTVLLVACGGGGSAGTLTGSAGATANGKIQLGLFGSNNVASNLVTSASGLTAKATVTDSAGKPAQNVVVTFTLGSTIAAIQPSSGTALTDSSGVAQVTLVAGSGTGADTLTASTTLPGASAISTAATFTVGAPPAAIPTAVNFISASPSNNSIVIKGAGGNGRTEVALLTFSVVDSTNTGIPNRKVNFTLQKQPDPLPLPLILPTLVSASGITDSTGRVTAAISSGNTPTTIRVITTVDGTSISTLSDTVTVTTGQPTQTSFTVLREKPNVEGINFGNVTNKITVLLADKDGGVVANGTPVVFTTDSGAIIGDQGTTASARCLTGPPNPPGECSVVWRSQAPNKSIVTVTATSFNGTDPTPLSGSTQFSNSATSGILVQTKSQFMETPQATPPNTIALMKVIFICPAPAAQLIDVKVTDGNPYTTLDNMVFTVNAPNGTTLTSVNPQNEMLTIFPGIVSAPEIPSPLKSLFTVHTLTITPNSTCTPNTTGQVTLQVKTPLGAAQNIPIAIVYQ